MKVLLVFIEPATYVVDLIRVLNKDRSLQLDVVFLEEALTQNWSADIGINAQVLGGRSLQSIVCLTKLVATGRYDVIHLAGWGNLVLLAMIIVSRLFPVKVTLESDTPLPVQPIPWKAAARRMFYPLLFRMVDGFLPAGRLQTEYLRHYGVPDSSITTAGMTVDVESMIEFGCSRNFSAPGFRKRHGIQESFVIVFVGRLEPHKGLFDLLGAFQGLARPDTRLLVVGDGSLRLHIEQLAGPSSKITYIGRLEGHDLWEAYLATNLLVLPSRHEPWGLVVNEAMAFRVPVLISDVVGCRSDLVDEGVTGCIHSMGDVSDLRNKMLTIRDNPLWRIEMAKSASNLIADWTLANEAANIKKAWQSL